MAKGASGIDPEASDSSKFYTPGKPALTNDAAVEQELKHVGCLGCYIFTVDGPRVTADYNAGTTAGKYRGTFNFVKRSTAGCGLDGEEFMVAERERLQPHFRQHRQGRGQR